MRKAFSDALVAAAIADRKILLLTGDHGYALFDDFRRECPDQYINCGIAEQNMVGVSAGLARSGFRPIVYGLSAFIPVRVVEQIKIDVAHDKLPVIFIGDGAGFVYSHLGTSHQSTEDIACTRAIPNLAIYSPADRFELTACLGHAYQIQTPVYFRIGKADRGDVHCALPIINAGNLLQMNPGQVGDIAIIATGSMVRVALDIALPEHPGAAVWSAPCIKPINIAQVSDICAQSRALVVMEEHSVHGGLGSLIAEIATATAPRKILRIGVNDRFSHYCGSYDYLLLEHGLDHTSIAMRIRAFLKNA